mgnify:CR=1 FL=1
MNQGTVRPLFTPSPLALRCSGLRVRFGRTQALDGLDLELAAGFCGSVSGSIFVTVGQPHIKVDSITVGGR